MILGVPPLRDSDIADIKSAPCLLHYFQKIMEASSGSPRGTLQKFNSSPLTRYLPEKRKACLPNHYVSGAMLNFGGV